LGRRSNSRSTTPTTLPVTTYRYTSTCVSTPPPSNPSETRETTKPLGIPVQLEEGEEPTMFTGDWVISSPHLLSTLFPSSSAPDRTSSPKSVNLIAILSQPIPFPPPRSTGETEEEKEETLSSLSDSNLFVFPPKALNENVGTVTALQVGKGTMSCPDGYRKSILISSTGSSVNQIPLSQTSFTCLRRYSIHYPPLRPHPTSLPISSLFSL